MKSLSLIKEVLLVRLDIKLRLFAEKHLRILQFRH